jgi:hypothetical protein
MTENITITDAFWEKRNLGVAVYEVIVNEKASVDELDPILEIGGGGIYVKIHCENTAVIEKLSLSNFVHTENQFSIQKRLQKIVVPDIYVKTLRFLEPHIINSIKEAQTIFDELDKDLFTTDRIALDNNFSVKIANLRYKNWITDMINSGDFECAIIKTKSESVPVAFYINKYDGKIANCILGGVFNNYKNRGIGHSFIYFAIENSIKQNCKMFKTQVSGNNVPIFNIYSSIFGFEITGNYVVLKKFTLDKLKEIDSQGFLDRDPNPTK